MNKMSHKQTHEDFINGDDVEKLKIYLDFQ